MKVPYPKKFKCSRCVFFCIMANWKVYTRCFLPQNTVQLHYIIENFDPTACAFCFLFFLFWLSFLCTQIQFVIVFLLLLLYNFFVILLSNCYRNYHNWNVIVNVLFRSNWKYALSNCSCTWRLNDKWWSYIN